MTPADYPMSRVLPDDTRMELKCATVQPVITFLRKERGDAGFREVISATRMNPDYLAQEGSWISFDYVCRLFAKLVEETGNPNAPFEVCQRHMNRHTVIAFLAHVGSPVSMYKLISKCNHLWDRVCKYEIREEESNHLQIGVQYFEKAQDRNNCLAVQGSLSAMPAFFGAHYAHIEHKQCACDGGDTCVYDIYWKGNRVNQYVWMGTGAGIIGAVTELLLFGPSPVVFLCALLTVLLGHKAGSHKKDRTRLDETFESNEEQSRCLLESMTQLEELNASLQSAIEGRTAELQNTNAALNQAYDKLKTSQKLIIEQERQAAVGVLAAGIAHEINSPLNGISLSVEAFSESEVEEPALVTLIGTAQYGVRKCKRLVNQLLSFSREQPRVQIMDLGDAVRRAVAQFRNDKDASDDIAVDLSVESALPSLPMDTLQVEQIVLNLLSNASKALDGHGHVGVKLARSGDIVELAVIDQGHGMDPQVARQIFDPFFKGKHSEGLGLGLSITHNLVQANGGTIECVSAKNQGTTFHVRFPIPAQGEANELGK